MSAPNSQAYYGNVQFIGVARIAGQGMVIASHAYHTKTDLNGVKQVLEQPNMNMAPGKHYSFNSGDLAWHLIADDVGLTYILITKGSYPQRCAHACLEELQRTFIASVGDKARTAKDRSLDGQAANLLTKICKKYDNLNEVDKLASVALKVDSIKLVMQDNVDMALQNCVKLESIEKAAEELQQQAGVFKKSAHDLKKKMWWKNIKMKLIIGGVILAILGIIVGVAVAMTGTGSKK